MRTGRSFSAPPALMSPRVVPSVPRRAPPRLKNPELLEALPPDVRDYFDGRAPADLAAVLRWALDNDETEVLHHEVETDLKGPVRVVDLNQMDVLQLAVRLGLEIELPLQCRIDTHNAPCLLSFLETPDAKVKTLHLDLSSKVNGELFGRLCMAMDHLHEESHLSQLEVRIDGLTERPQPFPGVLRAYFGESRACMSLSATARRFILQDPALEAKVGALDIASLEHEARACRHSANHCLHEAELLRKNARTLREGSHKKEVQAGAASRQYSFEEWQGKAEQLERDMEAMRLAPGALASFLAMRPLKDGMLDALAYVARRFDDENLMRAVCTLAPHYVMELCTMPDPEVISLVSGANVPCSLRLSALPHRGLWPLLREWRSTLVGLELTLVEHLGGDDLRALVLRLADLVALQDFSFTLGLGASVSREWFDDDLILPSGLDSLTLQGACRPGTAESDLLEWMIHGLKPRQLMLGCMTDRSAANLIPFASLRRLDSLFISCTASPEEPALVKEVEAVLREPHNLIDVTIRTEQPLWGLDRQVLSALILRNPLLGTIRIEHYSPERGAWEGYVNVNLVMRRVTEVFFSQHLGLPEDMGAFTAGILSARELPALMSVSKSTYAAGLPLKIRQSAAFLAFDLMMSLYAADAVQLRAVIADAPEPDRLIREVRAQLALLPDSEAALALLAAAAVPAS